MNQSEFLSISCDLHEAREKSRLQGFGFASHWLKNLPDILKAITKRSNRVITFDSHVKTALLITEGPFCNLDTFFFVQHLTCIKRTGIPVLHFCWILRLWISFPMTGTVSSS